MATIAQDMPLEAPDKEAAIKRNPHADFASVEASREQYNLGDSWKYLKSPNPAWKIGDGANNDDWKKHKMVSIDPNDPVRTGMYNSKEFGGADLHWGTVIQNYKLTISSTVPRPIALVSTVSADGKSSNLAPFSYFQNVCDDVRALSFCIPSRRFTY
jgi:hypothetical protein